MNVRDPFGLHRNPAIGILRATATQAAREFREKAIEAGANALEKGKQAKEVVESVVESALENASFPAVLSEAESAAIIGNDMAFSMPQNVPSFNNPQRVVEDQLWSATTRRGGGGGGGGNNFLGGVSHLLDGAGLPGRRSQGLPMYKDKPFAYPPSGRARPFFRQKRVLALLLLAIFAVLSYLGWFDGHTERVSRVPLQSWEWLKAGREDETAGGRGGKADWLQRRERVVEAFQLSWDAYERYAWGYDEFHPETKLGKQMAPKGLGWIIIDALDTMMLMNQTTRLVRAREWVAHSLTWEQDQDVNTFETTIRMMGGLLSAHYLSEAYPQLASLDREQLAATGGDDLYLEKAKDLADRLLSAFDSKTGVPWSSVNIGKAESIPSHDAGGAASTAEATTLQLEFRYLAKLTGEKVFWDKAEHVMQVVDEQSRAFDTLVPIYLDPTTGTFTGRNIRLGSRGDSYYEYLIKQFLQTNMQEPQYLDMWRDTLAAVRRHLVTYTTPSHFTIVAERPEGLAKPLLPKMDHLVCFLPGTIALAATRGLPLREARKAAWWTRELDRDMKLAHELTQTCWGMYKYMATGLSAEITFFHVDEPPLTEEAMVQRGLPLPPAEFSESAEATWRQDFQVKSQDKHNLQRPETAESLFYMWRITGDVRYREWGWEMFKSFMNYTAVPEGGGFTSLSDADVIPPVTRDNMESFWMAETLKYFYLLFSPDDLLPLDQIVINTEAHPFPRFDMGPLFSTGWKRAPYDAKDVKV